MSAYTRIGEVLVERGHLTPEDLTKALVVQRQQNKRLGWVLVSLGMVSEETIAKCMAEQYDTQCLGADELVPSRQALALFPPIFVVSRQALPLQIDGGRLVCAIADPTDLALIDASRYFTHLAIDFVVATPTALAAAIEAAFAPAQEKPEPVKKPGAQDDRKALLRALEEAA